MSVRVAIEAFLPIVRLQFPTARAILFGSWARGDARQDSDVDVAVLLAGAPGDFLRVKLDMADMAFDTMLKTGVLVHPLPIWESEWDTPEEYRNPALLRNIKREGVAL